MFIESNVRTISPFRGYPYKNSPVLTGSVVPPNSPIFGFSSVFDSPLTPPNKLDFSSVGLSSLFAVSPPNKLAFGVSLLAPKRLGLGRSDFLSCFPNNPKPPAAGFSGSSGFSMITSSSS